MNEEKPPALPVDDLITTAMDRLKAEADPEHKEDTEDTGYLNNDYLP